METVNIQIQERKTLEFFQKMCQIDNPYVRKVEDFNNQFLKLAGQIVQKQQSLPEKPLQKISQKVPQSLPQITPHKGPYKTSKQVQPQPMLKMPAISIIEEQQQQKQTVDSSDKASHTSELIPNNNSRFTQFQSNKTVSSQAGEKKMGIGSMKKRNKDQMKEFIMNTLKQNKVADGYVVKKGGPQGEQKKTFMVDDRGHLTNHSHSNNKREVHTMKSIKSPPPRQREKEKEVVQIKKRVNEKELEKKKNQAVQKMKQKKPQKERNKEKHGTNLNKMLVDMVRKQEKQKQNKEQREQQIKLQKIQRQNNPINQHQQQQKIVQPSISMPLKHRQKSLEKETIVEQIQIERTSKDSKEDEIKEQIVIQETFLRVQKQQLVSKKVQIEIKVQVQVDQKIQQKRQSAVKQVKKKEIKDVLSDKICSKTSIEANQQQQQQHQQNKPSTNLNPNETLQQNLTQLQQIKNSLQPLQPFQPLQIHNSNNTDQSQGSTLTEATITQPQRKQPINKKCYNQEYWIHIREEAELKIKRFREEKELHQVAKNKVLEDARENIEEVRGEQKSMKQEKDKRYEEDLQQLEEIQQQQEKQNMMEKEEEASEEDKFIEKRKKQLSKMIKDHNTRKQKPKATPALQVIQKSLHPRPQFPYLDIYPSFLHIFSLPYCKPVSQAQNELPVLLKQLQAMYTSHIHHFKEKLSFKPAVFLPFDSSNNAQCSNPKQLIYHAENTYVNLKTIMERLEIFNANLHGQFEDRAEKRFYRVVKNRQEVYDIISTGFLRRKGWKELPHGCSLKFSWNLFWSWAKPDVDLSKLLVFQKINHFPFNKNMSRKDLLYKNLDSFRKTHKIHFPFLPLTFNLPKQFTQFSIKFHEEEMLHRDHNFWIMKPIGKSRGRGIKVINNLAELNYIDNIVVQKYLSDPLLIEGYKFDMRIYVLVTHFHPLEAFIYTEGFARLSTEKYSMQPMHIKNSFMHLTNFAVNRNNVEPSKNQLFAAGSKLSLKVLRSKLAAMGYSWSAIWAQVTDIINKSLIACSVSLPDYPSAFELFGYDIMLDKPGNCHLIQINASPSLQRSFPLDEIIKQSLIDDILDIVDAPNFDKQALLDIITQRQTSKKKYTKDDDLIDIARILKYQKLRRIGEVPEKMGLFQMIAPSRASEDLEKLIKGRSGANNMMNID